MHQDILVMIYNKKPSSNSLELLATFTLLFLVLLSASVRISIGCRRFSACDYRGLIVLSLVELKWHSTGLEL